MEIRAASNSLHFFEREHNTLWLKFDISSDGLFAFRIIPKDTTYDYDFLLFKVGGQNLCESLADGLKPVRSNISRNDPSKNSITGLKFEVINAYMRSGPGINFSSAINVLKGDRYYLAIDNVYGGNSPFFIEFTNHNIAEISGTILNDEQEPMKAQITFEDAVSGDLLAQSESDPVTGEFTIEVPIDAANKKARYNLTAYSDKHFFSEISLSASDINSPEHKLLKLVVSKLKKGNRLLMHNINFEGNSHIPLPGSEPSFNRLRKVMVENASLKILIEGHTNGCGRGKKFSQDLSERRARTVNDFLLDNKVNSERLSTQGFNCSRMLYPAMRTPMEQMLNRRVEIVVVDY